jgi:hypothetical protein
MLFAGLLALGGCSSLPMVGDKSEMVEVKSSDGIPLWYIEPQSDTEQTVYGAGTGESADIQFALDKAMHQAKVALGDKLSTIVSSEMKGYTTDTTSEMQKISKTGFANVDVSKYRVEKKTVSKEQNKFRVYVLLSVNRVDAKVPQQELDNL